MSRDWQVLDATETGLARLAELIALKLLKGDTIALFGDLGAGKTTFARSLIRAVLCDAGAEIPSPTFSIVQAYDSPRLEISHLDLYRLTGEDEVSELGLDENARHGALIIEWPERAPSLLSPNRLEIALAQGRSEETRHVRLSAFGTWDARLERIRQMSEFLVATAPWNEARVTYLQGDASARGYARLVLPSRSAVLMDQPSQPDGPAIRHGLPYSRIAHLAEDVRPFVAVATTLAREGLSAPEVYSADLEQGFLIIEDFGERVFGAEIKSGTSQAELWQAATETLVALARAPVPEVMLLQDGSTVALPAQDASVLSIEIELLPDWYWPALKRAAMPPHERDEFLGLWAPVFERVARGTMGWVLRDYHSPNLMWLPDRKGPARTGLLDFQDALLGSPAYDLVSLLQDARVDVPETLERDLLRLYYRERAGDVGFDAKEFQFAYAALGAQRNTKILGIFARLAKRDQKPHYLAHIPRIWRYLARCLSHPDLADLQAWYDRHFPAANRDVMLEV